MYKNMKTAARRKSYADKMNIKWSGEKEKLQGISKNKCAFHGKLHKYLQVEAALYQYVMNMQKKGFAISVEMLQFEGRRLARKYNITEFKVSYG
jgi:hypothetical protein